VEREHKVEEKRGKISYFVIIAIFCGIVIFGFMNLYEPQIDRQYDFFELMFPISEFVAAGFGFIIAKKYWGSKVFGKAFLSLSVGLVFAGIGTLGFGINEVIYGLDNPIPNWNDFFSAAYFLLVLYHLISCIRYFLKKQNKKLTRENKLIIILLPITATAILVIASYTSVTITGSVPELNSQYIHIGDSSFRLNLVDSPSDQYQTIMVYDPFIDDDVIYELVPVELTTTNYEQMPTTEGPVDFVPLALSDFNIGPLGYEIEFGVADVVFIYFYALTTLNLSFAIVGAQVFRNTRLGSAWGLLLLGIALIAVADLIYYSNAIYGYDRTYPDLAFWVFGYTIIAYALYLHRKLL